MAEVLLDHGLRICGGYLSYDAAAGGVSPAGGSAAIALWMISFALATWRYDPQSAPLWFAPL